MYNSQVFKCDDIKLFKQKALSWASCYDTYQYLTNHDLSYPFGSFRNLLAVGSRNVLVIDKSEGAFNQIKEFRHNNIDWIFGYFGYDLKNDIESLESNNPDYKAFPECILFQPEHLIEFIGSEVHIRSSDPVGIHNVIEAVPITVKQNITFNVNFQSTESRDSYITTVEKLRSHIYEGDMYEINYCLEFFTKTSPQDFSSIQQKLFQLNPSPFASGFKHKQWHIACSSPERFLKKTGQQLISQPIKGTIEIGETEEDKKRNAEKLRSSEKERAENMMIVDLVRNDLAKSSISGSVKVEEIFGIYPFRHLFQMISTVSSQLKDGVDPVDAIKNAFPMGSMTGAPKKKVMELIEFYEHSKRGVYSGAMGYFSPEGNFDFNVIIRSLFYNDKTGSLSYQVGSAITYDSDPASEYEECLLKARAILKLFNNEGL
jgi:para-aminobenzoate synthetase component 1